MGEATMMKAKKGFQKAQFLPYAAGVGALVLATGTIWGVCAFTTHHAMTRAQAMIQKGFGGLASETLEPYRHSLVKSDDGCRVLIGAYFTARQAEKLEWAAQACLNNGHEIPESYIGYAASREFTGRDTDALQILGSVVGKFSKSPDIFYRIANILRRNKRDADAVAAYEKAAEIAPDNQQLAMEALQYFSSLQRWPDAKAMAEHLKDAKTDNPEVKLVIARALARGGDRGAADAVISQAKDLMAKNPNVKAALEKAYPDVLGVAGQGSPADQGKTLVDGNTDEPSRGLASVPEKATTRRSEPKHERH